MSHMSHMSQKPYDFEQKPYDLAKTCQKIVSSARYEPLAKVLDGGMVDTFPPLAVREAQRQKIQHLWEALLHDPAYGFCLQTDDDEACFYDTGNADVRTEGQSYGMLLAALLDDKVFFDNVWRWTLRHMYLEDGPCRGYFAWSVPLDGRARAEGPAPDGEVFFCLALILAHERWGSVSLSPDEVDEVNPKPSTELAYLPWARKILYDMLHRQEGEAAPMFQDNGLIAFVPGAPFTDPSYLLPHAFELFAQYAIPEDQGRWQEIAQVSRDFLLTKAQPQTGLYPEYANNDGTPEEEHGHSSFYSDAYRCMINLAVDALSCGLEAEASEIATKQAMFFAARPEGERWLDYTVEGIPTGRLSLHPVGLQASLACTSILSDDDAAKAWRENFEQLPLRQGERRYYDNLLYLFSYLALSGWYRI